MKKIFTILLLIGAFCLESCGPITAERTKSPQELQAELMLQEHNNSDQYFQVEATMGPNIVKTREAGLFRKAEYGEDGYNVTGTITSTASIAKFKDAVLTIDYFSQTGTLLQQEDHVFYEFFNPNSVKNFELHVYPPAEMKKFGVRIKSVTPAY